MPSLEKRLLELERRINLLRPPDNRFAAYLNDPLGYARDVLKVRLTDPQSAILAALVEPPFKVLVPSGHSTGKTFVAGVAVNFWYDTRDPGLVISTAPTERDVVDLLWTEVRMQRTRAGLPMDFIGPSAPHMRTAPDHYAKGYTASKGESFQGRHQPRKLFVFDEANGIDPLFWTTTKTMFDADSGDAWLSIFNPTSTTTQAYAEDQAVEEDGDTPRWSVHRLSALDHPNITGTGRVPGAVSPSQVTEWVKDWCEPLQPGDGPTVCDVEWPPGSGCWHKPGPIFQSRALGLWPDAGDGVWSDALFQACLRGPCPPWPRHELPQIGCDTATGKGDDFHAIHARWGSASFHHETSNTMDPARIFDRVKAVAAMAADLVTRERDPKAARCDPKRIPIRIDDDGTGNAVAAFLKREGYSCMALGAGTKANDPELYPRRRDELWFAAAKRAKHGGVYLGLLDKPTRLRLKRQLLAPEWQIDPLGKRKVEGKPDTKEKIGRSPDDADAFNLSHASATGGTVQGHEPAPGTNSESLKRWGRR